MDTKAEFNRINSKLDVMNNKLDDHLGRLSKAEEAITWMKGHIKIVTTMAVGVVLAMIPVMLNIFGA